MMEEALNQENEEELKDQDYYEEDEEDHEIPEY